MADIASLLMAQAPRRSDPRAQQRRYAQLLMGQGAQAGPVGSPLEGIARALQGGIGGFLAGHADRGEKEDNTADIQSMAALLSAGTPEEMTAAAQKLRNPDIAGPLLSQAIAERQKTMRAGKSADSFGDAVRPPPPGTQTAVGGALQAAPAALPAQGGGDSAAIAGIEVKGQPNNGYQAVGPVTVVNGKPSRPHGRYQVMDFNIGPWTQEILGTAMTPEQFTAPTKEAEAAQEAVFKAKFGQYRQKYGDRAASAWFAGEKGMNNPNAKDVNGTTVQGYQQKFAQAGGAGPQVAQGADIPGRQPAQPPADASGTPVPPQQSNVPDVPRPTPSPDQIKKYQDLIRSGGMNEAQARAALDQETQKEWDYLRENRRMQWKEDLENQRVTRKGEEELRRAAPMALVKQQMETYEKEGGGRQKGEAAVQEIQSIHQVRQLLDAGAFTGAGADSQAFGSRVAQSLGIDWGADTQANTAALQSAVGNRVLALVKNLGAGTGISNADREYAEKIAGGQISAGEPAMRKILDIGERAARINIKSHDTGAARLRKAPGVAELGEDYFKLPEAPTYADWSKANPPQTTQQTAPGAATPATTAAPQKEIPRLTDPSQVKNLKSGDQFYTPDGRLKVVP